MLEISRKSKAILFNFSSEIPILTNVIDEVEKFLTAFNLNDLTKTLLVTRELLMNAVVHGNRNDPNRLVFAGIEAVNHNQLKIMVKDEGEGFHYQDLELELPPDPRHMKNRGYKIINALSDRIEFNDSGNQVTVFIDITKDKKI